MANHVPLQEGENTITANPESGIATLDTTLRIDATFTPSMIDIVKLPGGPDPLEYLPGSESNETIARLDQTGLYFFTAIAEDDQGNTYTDTVAIQVINEAVLDALLRAKWEGMRAALIAGDIEEALTYHQSDMREKYAAIYSALGSELPVLTQQMREISPIYFDDVLAKYRIRQDHNIDGQTVTITYYIYFRRDENGLWLIEKY